MDLAATHSPTDDRPLGAAIGLRLHGIGRLGGGLPGGVLPSGPRSSPPRGSRLPWPYLLTLLLLVLMLLRPFAAHAGEAEITGFELTRNEEGVLLNYAINVDLSHSVDDALGKAVPLYFVAEAEVFRNRWYWRDLRVAHAVRIWKIVFQPLTSTYRVTLGGGLSQNYDSRDEALASITRGARWKLAEPGQVGDGGSYYLEFSFRLDTSMLPRPMQIGIGGQPEWAISVRRNQRIN